MSHDLKTSSLKFCALHEESQSADIVDVGYINFFQNSFYTVAADQSLNSFEIIPEYQICQCLSLN